MKTPFFTALSSFRCIFSPFIFQICSHRFDKISLAISKRDSKYDEDARDGQDEESEEESDEEDDSNEKGGGRKEAKKAEDSQQPKEGRIVEAGKQRDAASPGLQQQDSEVTIVQN